MNPGRDFGVEIISSGVALPQQVVTNRDLESVMDTTDEWISQRTGIHQRYTVDPAKGESTRTLALSAAKAALQNAELEGSEIDFVIVATMTPDMPTPATAPMIAHGLGTLNAGAYDLSAACSGFVFGLNTSAALITTGAATNMLLVGVDLLSRHIEFSTRGRSTSVLFGDAAAAVVMRRCEDSAKGLLAQTMASDGGGATHLYIPCDQHNMLSKDDDPDAFPLEHLRMHGPSVFKFAVTKFPKLIADTLDKASLTPDQIDHYVCHQSNARILEAARQRFNIPNEKLRVNIGNYGNTVAASIPLVFNELKSENKVQPGQKIMFLGFGAGLTWGSSLWQF